MPRDSDVYRDDIRAAVEKIQRYTHGLSRDTFAADEKTVDAVVRNLEVIGEAVKNLDAAFRSATRALTGRRSPASVTCSPTSTSASTSTSSGTSSRARFQSSGLR